MLCEAPPRYKQLVGRWDVTDMAKKGLLGRIRWHTSAAVASYLKTTGSELDTLIFSCGGRSHLWVDPCLAAFMASQIGSPQYAEFAKVSVQDNINDFSSA